MADKINSFQSFLIKWSYTLLPFFMMLCVAMAYRMYEQQNMRIDTKADKAAYEESCRRFDERLESTSIRQDYQRDIQVKQLEMLTDIKMQLVAMNKKGEK